MVLLFTDNIDAPFVITLVAMLIESYIAINYVTKSNSDYNYDDKTRLIVGILCILTIVFSLFQWKTLAAGLDSQSMLLIISIVGSAITASYFLAPMQKDYKTDWRRKFTEIFYYIAAAIAIAAAVGIKEARTVVREDANAAFNILNTVEKTTIGLGRTGFKAGRSLGTGVRRAGSDLYKGVRNATDQTVSGVTNASGDLVSGITRGN